MNFPFTSQVKKEPTPAPEFLQGSFWEGKAGDNPGF